MSKDIVGVKVIVTTRSDAIRSLSRAIRERRGRTWGFCNAHMVNCARLIPGYRDVLGKASLFNDGIGLNIASRILYGTPFPENLNGTDFTSALLASFDQPTSVFLLGSAPGVAERAAAKMLARFQNVRIAGTRDGFFDANEEPAILRDIIAAEPQLVLVGMGNPHQEFWATRHTDAIRAPLLCVGAYLDFTADVVKRAPSLVRRLKLEWAYRLVQEPRRLARRYLIGNVTFLASVMKQKMAHL